jgi:hypothetical protein
MEDLTAKVRLLEGSWTDRISIQPVTSEEIGLKYYLSF